MTANRILTAIMVVYAMGTFAICILTTCTPSQIQTVRTIVDNVNTLCGDIEHGAIVLPGKAGQESIVLCAQSEEAQAAANKVLERRAKDALSDAGGDSETDSETE